MKIGIFSNIFHLIIKIKIQIYIYYKNLTKTSIIIDKN
jgi:hypothetical protein